MTKQSGSKFFQKKDFRFYFLIYLLALLFLAAFFLILLHFGLGAYERSQEERPVKEFVQSLQNDETLYALLSEKLTVSGSIYESREEILKKAYLPACRDGVITFGRDHTVQDAGDDERHYAVYLGEEKIFSLSLLREKNGAGFFMDSWTLWDTQSHQEGFGVDPAAITVIIQEGASLQINGVDAGGVKTAHGIHLCVFEKDGISADVHEIPELYLPPEITVTGKNGVALPCSSENGGIYYYLGNEEGFYDYTFTVPHGVEVYLNEILLTKASCFSYESADYPDDNISSYGMPDATLYSVRHFRTPPEVTASYQGVTLKPALANGGSHYIFTYPQETLYTLRTEVPSGAQVYVGGVELPSSMAVTSEMNAFGLADYASYMETPPVTQVYELSGLYMKPDVKVLLDGKELKKAGESGEDGNTFSLLYSYLGYADEALQAEQSEFIEKFVRAYVKYVGMGRTGLDDNRYNLQTYTLRSSAAYRLVNSSYDELIWVTQYSGMEYNYLRTSDYIPLSEDCYRCSAAFSVDISRSGVEKHFESEMTILVIYTNGKWKVVDFSFN